jgi:hypothetical protein
LPCIRSSGHRNECLHAANLLKTQSADEKITCHPADQHKGSLTHELLAGAAGFEALKAYNDYEAKQGKPQNYAFVKELLAGFAAAEVDKLCETKGLDYLDRQKAKKQAEQQAHAIYEEKYGAY